VLIIVGEVFIELFTVGEKLKQTWIALKLAVYGLALAFIEAMKYNPATILYAATLEATGAVDALKQKGWCTQGWYWLRRNP
jgi:hypothetical protein